MSRNDIPKIPEATPADLKRALMRLREEVQVLMGLRGNPRDAAVLGGGTGGGGTTIIIPGGGGGGGSGPDPDLTPPPTVSGFTGTAGIFTVFLEWSGINYTQGRGNKQVNIYGVKRLPINPSLPTFGDAAIVAVAPHALTVLALDSDPNVRWHLWAKFETNDGVESVDPAGGVHGLTLQTAQDPSALLELLQGQIRESELAAALASRINLIDATALIEGSVAWRVLQETNARAAAVAAEAQARAEALLNPALNPAIGAAAAAQLTIDNEVIARAAAIAAVLAVKNRTFYSDTAPVSDGNYTLVVGDTWIETDNGNKRYRWNGSAWVAADDTRIGQLVTDLQTEVTQRQDGDTAEVRARESLYAAIAGAGDYKVFHQPTAPAGLAAADIGAVWTWTTGGGVETFSRWSGTAWVDSRSNRRAALYLGAFATLPPSADVIGDLALRTSDNMVFVWNGAAWVERTVTAAAFAFVDQERFARISAVAAESGRLDLLVARVESAEASILNDFYTKAEANAVIASSTATVSARLNSGGDVFNSIVTAHNTATAAADLGATTAQSVTTLQSQVGGVNDTLAGQATAIATLQTDYSTTASTTAAIANASTALTAAYQAADTALGNTLNAAIANVATAAADANAATAGTVTTLATQMRGNVTGNDAAALNALTSGLLYHERLVRSTQTASLSQQITLLSAGAGEQFDFSNIWYFDNGVDGWSGVGTNSVTSAVGGWLRFTSSSSTTNGYVQSPDNLNINGAQYTQAKARIRKIGTPTWEGKVYFTTTADNTYTEGKSQALAEPSFDGGIAVVTWNMPTAWTGATVRRVRIDLSDPTTSANYFEIDWVAIGRPSPGASSAQLFNLQEAQATDNAARVQDITTLSGTVNNPTTGVVATATALDAVKTTVNNPTTGVVATSNKATLLQSGITNGTAGSLLPSNFVDGLTYWTNVRGGNPATIATASGTIIDNDADFGRCVQISDWTTAGQNILTTGVVPAVAGRVYKVTARFKVTASDGSVRFNIIGVGQTDTYAVDGTSFYPAVTVTGTGAVQTLTQLTGTPTPAGGSASPAGKYLRFGLRLDTAETGLTLRVASLVIEDITEVRASAASTLATIAESYVTTANQTLALASLETSLVAQIGTGDSAITNNLNNATPQYTSIINVKNTADAAASQASTTATSVTTLQSQMAGTTGSALKTSIETEATTRASETAGLFAQYTVKLDVNGYVSGFGLASTLNNGVPFSDFQIRADRFSITNPAAVQVAISSLSRSGTTATMNTATAHGLVVGDDFSIRGVSNDGGWNRSWKVLTRPSTTQVTFAVPNTLTTPATVTNAKAAIASIPFIVDGGKVVIDGLLVKDATINRAAIALAAIDNARIADLSAAKITGGTMQVGSFIQSTNYTSGGAGSGWRINADGTAELQAAYIRGQLTATQINGNGLTIRTPAGAVILDASGTGNMAWSVISGAGRPLDYAQPNDPNIVLDPTFSRAVSDPALWQFMGGPAGTITTTQGEGSTPGLRLLSSGGPAASDALNAAFIPMRQGDTLHVRARVWLSAGFPTNMAVGVGVYEYNRSFAGTNAFPRVNASNAVTGAWIWLEGSFAVQGATTQYGRVYLTLRETVPVGHHAIFSDVYVSKVQFGATVGAPAGTNVGSTAATMVESNAANGASAWAALPGINTALDGKLTNSGSQVLGAIVRANVVTAPVGFVAGSLVWNATGNWTSGTGIALTPAGIVAHNGTKATLTINASNGNAIFGGELSAATGSFEGSVSIAGRAWETGNGVWTGLEGGFGAIFVGNNSQYLRYTARTGRLEIKLAVISASITGTLTTVVGNGRRTYGTASVAPTGGEAPYTYAWDVATFRSNISGEAVEFYLTGNLDTASVTVAGSATNNSVSGTIRCIIKDANGQTLTVLRNHTGQHGTQP